MARQLILIILLIAIFSLCACEKASPETQIAAVQGNDWLGRTNGALLSELLLLFIGLISRRIPAVASRFQLHIISNPVSLAHLFHRRKFMLNFYLIFRGMICSN